MIIQTLKFTPDYKLGVSNKSIKEGPVPTYWVVNKVTDVVEAETAMLPQAYEWIEQLQAGLDALKDMAEEPKTELT